MMFRLLSLCLAVMAVCGCASTPAAKKYTVGLPETAPLAVPAAVLDVRMAEDLRAYRNPLVFAADGTVAPCRGLVYYAPLELALARALQDVSAFARESGTLRITVRDFHADCRGAEPVARVTLEATNGNTASATAPLPADWTPEQLREALAGLLLKAYTALLAPPAA